MVGIELLANLPKQQWDYLLDGLRDNAKDNTKDNGKSNLLQQFAARIFTHLLGGIPAYETFCGQCGFWIAVECEDVPSYLPKNFAIHKNRFLTAFNIVYDWMETNLSKIWDTCCDPIVYVRSKYHPSFPSKRILWIGTRYELLTSGNVAALTSACPPPCQHGKTTECECLPSLWEGSFVWSPNPRTALSEVAFSGPKLTDNQLFKMCALNVETDREYQTQLKKLLTDENIDYVLMYSDYLIGPPKKPCLLIGNNMSKKERHIFPAVGMFRFVLVIDSEKDSPRSGSDRSDKTEQDLGQENKNSNARMNLQEKALWCANQFFDHQAREKPNLIVLLVSKKDNLEQFPIITKGCTQLTPKIAARPLACNCYWIKIHEFNTVAKELQFSTLIVMDVFKARAESVSQAIKEVYACDNFESVVAYGSKPEINPHVIQLFPVEYWLHQFQEPLLTNRIRFFQEQCMIMQKPQADTWNLRMKSQTKTKRERGKKAFFENKSETKVEATLDDGSKPIESKPTRSYVRRKPMEASNVPKQLNQEELAEVLANAPKQEKARPKKRSISDRSRSTKMQKIEEEDEPIFKNHPLREKKQALSLSASPLTLLWEPSSNNKIHLLPTSSELTNLIQAYLPKPRFRDLLRSLHAGGRFISYEKLRAFTEVPPPIKTYPSTQLPSKQLEICLICLQVPDVQRALISPCQHQFCLSCLSR